MALSVVGLSLRTYELLLAMAAGAGMVVAAALVLYFPESEQSVLTGAIVICSLVIASVWCLPAARNKSDGRIDWLHPAVLVVLIYLVYYIFPGVWLWLVHDYKFLWVKDGGHPAYLINYTFILGAVSMAAFGLGCRSKLKFPGESLRNALYRADVWRPKEVRYLIFIFLLIGGALKIYHLSLYGPISLDLFRNLSPSERRESGVGLSMFLVMLESMLDWALFLFIFMFMMNYKKSGQTKGWVLLLAITMVVMLLDFMVLGKRSAVLLLLLLPMVWYHYMVKRLTYSKALSLFGIGGVLVGLLLIVRIAVPLLSKDMVATDYIGDNFLDIATFYFDTAEWSEFEMVMASVNQRDELLDAAGGMAGFLFYSFGTLVVFIPRVIWPDKPEYEDLSNVYYHVIFQSNENVGMAPTIWGASYLFFHLAGIIIGMYILGWVFKGIYSLLRPIGGGAWDVFLYSIFYWLAFQFLRFGTTAFLLLHFIQALAVGVLAVLFLARKKRCGNKVLPSMSMGTVS